MRNIRNGFVLLTIGMLSACTGSQSGRPVATGPREAIDLRDADDACGASLVQGLVGLRANDLLRRDIAERTRAPAIRWLEPGMAVTMDFRADRLNGELDQDGAITALRCG
jgi:Peptidase inhibitor I78 family